MLGSLVSVRTQDGIKLHGFFARPHESTDLWILVHGVNGNFYDSSLLNEIAVALTDRGQAVLLINTRGHDILSFNADVLPFRVGSQVEKIDDSKLDLDAWFGFAKDLGYQSVGLIGHSLGALKSCLWSTFNVNLASRLVLLSPPRLNTKLLLEDPKKGEVFREHLQDAAELCAAGNPDHVMRVRFPFPMWICASTYVDKYGSGEKYDYLELAKSLRIPCLWTFGELEVRNGSSNFAKADLHLQAQFDSNELYKHNSVRVIKNGDHSYRDAKSTLLQELSRWITNPIGL